jgi:hypothetical protein
VWEKNNSGLKRWGRGEREQEWEGRRREREGAGGDARRQRKRREWGEIWSEDGREMDERIRKRRERIENERSEGEQYIFMVMFVTRNPKTRRAK